MLWADMLNFYDCISTFCLFQWEFKEERIQNAHQISVTHITHILTQIRVQGGWCESDRRKLQERSAWANDRGSLHDITPDTFDRSFNVTTQPLTPTTDVTGKPGHACCTWTHVSVCMCAFCIYIYFNIQVPNSWKISNILVQGKSNWPSCTQTINMKLPMRAN